jgi:aryl-alcohol dehydrogenase-like predicted oxidoreductase
LNIPFVAFSPLARGLLAGHVAAAPARDTSDYRKGRRDFSSENIVRLDAALAPLLAIARQRNCSPAEIALAWLLSQSITAIPGARTRQHVIDICRAAEFTLDPQEIESLSRTQIKA